jgi:catechol 2,3-dioxygenase-like lactoylglutathione lyase family enzyme
MLTKAEYPGMETQIPEGKSPASPRLTLTGVVFDAPDAGDLAAFYRRLLGWTVREQETDWVTLIPPDGGTGLSFQTEPDYVRPIWPSTPGQQQMMLHLDIAVDDLDAACSHAVAAGAVLAEFQPQDDVRVFIDPAGHPFLPLPARPSRVTPPQPGQPTFRWWFTGRGPHTKRVNRLGAALLE